MRSVVRRRTVHRASGPVGEVGDLRTVLEAVGHTAARLVVLLGEPVVLTRHPVLRSVFFAVLAAVSVLAGHVATFPGTAPVLSAVPAVAILWLAGSAGRRRLAVDTGALVLVAAVVLHSSGEPAAASLLRAGAIAFHGLASAWAYRRLRPTGLELRTAQDLLVLAAGAGVGAALAVPLALLASATGGTLTPVSGPLWMLHGSISAFIVLAAVLRTGGLAADDLPRARTLERCGISLAVAITYVSAFWVAPGLSLAFLLLPVAVWVALRESLRAVTVHLVVLATGVVVAVRAEHSPWRDLPFELEVALAEAYLGALALTTLLLALFRADRERHARRAREQADLLGAVFASISDAVTVLDAGGNPLLRNRAADALFGGSDVPGAADAASQHGFFRLDGTRTAREDLPVVQALRGRTVVGVEGRLRTTAHPDGRFVRVSAQPLVAAPGAPWNGGAVAALHDVTDLRAATDEIARAHDLFASVLDAATEHAIVAVDTTGRITLFNGGAERMLGWSAAEVRGRSVLEIHHPEDLEALARQVGVDDPADLFTTTGASGPRTFRCRYRRRDGSRLTVSVTSAPMRDGDGRLTGFTSMATDVTAQLAAEQRIAESEALFRAAFDRNPTGIVLVAVDGDAPGRILRANRSMRRFAHRPQETLPGSLLLDLVDRAAAAALTAGLGSVTRGAQPEITLDSTFTHADGSSVVGEVTATLLHSRDGEPLLLCLVEDVTERRTAEEALTHQARHDGLTGLANRTLLRERLEREVAVRDRPLGVLYVDLDGFKAVNDSAGHAVGDQLLVAVARLLDGCVRAGDTVARLGGDEFAVLCPGATRAEAVAVGRRVLDALAEPIALDGLSAVVGASIGVRWWAGVPDPSGVSVADHLLAEADAAMYAAKRAGKGRVVVHELAPAGPPVAQGAAPSGR
jgi:diguanylate cyclase (GGDEF)-like protein/PAS domain S-box-containing protein